ncbi:unannotated protein [freshwater metagenome]|jgi:hypothetical protein|uniref:Unannotated protein n=1 Tax=freshwater metagenome TaxID=449393 RepID=A0A6J6WHV4_9ZZZZ|nr:hypothetical protein [Actinomycetota bacterium]MSY04155.1 hypothetical protein [Actinomycetota bacterium]MSY40430.1 hypothetical protein [Actinomycetota bacterium]MTA36560.1 hypothetical protein [Actinomycetota bacterium]MTA48146.1 hypothetical protein [Actinomycetota bacterium]
MESLALLVGILFLCALCGGPISFLITRIKVNQGLKRQYKIARAFQSLFVLFFALIGIVAGVGIAINATPIFVRLICLSGVAISILALKRQFIDGRNKI